MTSRQAIEEATKLTADAISRRTASIESWAKGYEQEARHLADAALLSASCATALMLTHGIVRTTETG